MLTVYDISQSEDWNNIVKSFRDYDIYYLNNYVKPFMVHGDGDPLLFYYQDEYCRGINVVMKRDVAVDKNFNGKLISGEWFDFATPYGYGGWLIEGENSDGLFDEYEKWCIDNHIVCEFVRFHPVLGNHVKANAYEVVALGDTVAMDLSSKEIIWNNLTSQNRNKLRKALKNGIRIQSGYSSELFGKFREIYNLTMDRDNANDYYYFDDDFYKSVYEQLKGSATLYYATVNDDEIAAMALIIYANGKMHYHLSGSKREYLSIAPTNPLLVEAAEWGSENGMKTLHLGGGFGSRNDSLLEFKKSFYRGELCRYHIGKKIFLYEKYRQLVELREGNIADSGFFPQYRG